MRRSRILIALLIAATALPGSAGAQTGWWQGWSMDDPRLSQPRYDELVFESIPIVADDGVPLDAMVLRPAVEDGVKLPAILQLSPYLPVNIQPATILPELQKHKYAQRGFALVAVSIRGFGRSGGCIDYQGERDRADTDTILNTIAAQPWSNGKIGAVGLSWEGTTLTAAMLIANPHLKTIVPVAANTDWYKWSYLKGIPAWYQGYSYSTYIGPLVWSGRGPPERLEERVCPNVPDALASQERSAALGVRDAWWDERLFTPLADRIDPDLAVLQVAGYRDGGVRVDNLNDWDPVLRARLANYRLIVGDWAHLFPDTPDIQATYNPEFRFNPHPMTYWSVLLLRWFDKYLNGMDTGIEAMPPALHQDQKGQWHAESALTPARAETTTLYPAANGTLGSAPGSGEVSFVDDGDNVDPRGTCAWAAGGIFFGCAPVHKPNVQFFVTEPYEEETRYSGVFNMNLSLRHSVPRGQVGVTVYDVDGARWEPMTYGFASFNLRESEYEYNTIEPMTSFEQTVELIARDFVVAEGHRLAVAVGAQVGMNPKGIIGNGFAPVPSGGLTTIELGPETSLELNELQGPTELLPIP